jgi:SAM-dependent methyltransferase
MSQLYDEIGSNYSRTRRADPRIAACITGALGSADTVVNIGAGTGSYEPADRHVVAVEPSQTMVRQRPTGSAPVVRASAMDLPFRGGAFAAAMAILTMHHWPDWERGLGEMMRVSRDGVVLLTWDPERWGFWLVDYLPELAEVDRVIVPTMDELRSALGPVRIRPVAVPIDCMDGFFGAYWGRPSAYLSSEVRSGISTFSKLGSVEAGLARLRHDIESGAWTERYGSLLEQDALEMGYRLVISGRLV